MEKGSTSRVSKGYERRESSRAPFDISRRMPESARSNANAQVSHAA